MKQILDIFVEIKLYWSISRASKLLEVYEHMAVNKKYNFLLTDDKKMFYCSEKITGMVIIVGYESFELIFLLSGHMKCEVQNEMK